MNSFDISKFNKKTVIIILGKLRKILKENFKIYNLKEIKKKRKIPQNSTTQ